MADKKNPQQNLVLQLKHVSKIYGDLKALDDLSLDVPTGQWLSIVGSSGSGKTTLMNIIGCLDQPSKGKTSWWPSNTIRSWTKRRPWPPWIGWA